MITEKQIVAVLRGETVEHDGLRLAWRVVHPDLRSTHDYRWPLPGQWAESDPGDCAYTEGNPCPQFWGDGLCLARTWRGAASGNIPAITGLICGYREEDVLGRDEYKLRVKRTYVFEIIDISALIRAGHMAGADMRNADLSGTNLREANLTGSNLTCANLTGANLRDADLRCANLLAADILHAILKGANLQDANLVNADLQDATLQRANLQDATLQDADLEGANLEGANLQDATLRNANLEGARLTDVNLNGADLYGVRGLEC